MIRKKTTPTNKQSKKQQELAAMKKLQEQARKNLDLIQQNHFHIDMYGAVSGGNK